MKKKILINASNISVGGGVQVARGIINHTSEIKNTNYEFVYIITKSIFNQLTECNQKNLYGRVYVVPRVSFFSSLNPFRRYHLRCLIKKVNPDLVFTVFGPFHVNIGKFDQIVGIAEPWLLFDIDKTMFPKKFTKRNKLKIEIFIKKIFIKKINYWWVESNEAKFSLIKKFGVLNKNVTVIPNKPYMYEYITAEIEGHLSNSKLEPSLDCLNIIYPAFPHIHKNHMFLIELLSEFKKRFPSIPFTLKLTLPLNNKETLILLEQIHYHNLENNVTNLGEVSVEELFIEYCASDLMIFPSLLEVSSASLAEAMLTKTLVLASDFSFNQSTVGGSFLFFDPKDDLSRMCELLSDIFNNFSKYHHYIEDSYRSALHFRELNTYQMHVELMKKYLNV